MGYQGIEIAISIMRCESGIRPEALGYNYRKGKLHSKDWSYWQINDKYWLDYYAKLGFNIKNPEHNLEVGFLLLSTDGVWPWRASFKCSGVGRQLAVK